MAMAAVFALFAVVWKLLENAERGTVDNAERGMRNAEFDKLSFEIGPGHIRFGRGTTNSALRVSHSAFEQRWIRRNCF
jgi:hypothetical protein